MLFMTAVTTEATRRGRPWARILAGLLLSVPLWFIFPVITFSSPSAWADFWLLLLAPLVGFGLAWGEWRRVLVLLFCAPVLALVVGAVFGLLGSGASFASGWTLGVLTLYTWGFIWGNRFGNWAVPRVERGEGAHLLIPMLLAFPGVMVSAPFEELWHDPFGRKQATLESARQADTDIPSAPLAGAGLYLTTFFVEGVCAVIRCFLLYIPLFFVLMPLHILMFVITQDSYDGGEWFTNTTLLTLSYTLVFTLLIAFWPVLRSLGHVLWPFGRTGSGPDERETLGAREPTRVEHAKILDALEQIEAQAGGSVAAPSDWLVLDEALPDAFTLGSTVYVTRAAVESEYLAGIIAHELGHVAHKDGDLLLGVRRLITPLAYYIGIDRSPLPAGAVLATGAYQKVVRSEDEKIVYRFKALQIKFWLSFWFGGLGLLWLGRQWAAFWRQRDFFADDYAVQLGQGDALQKVLEVHRNLDVVQPFLLNNRPYTAERLDRLAG